MEGLLCPLDYPCDIGVDARRVFVICSNTHPACKLSCIATQKTHHACKLCCIADNQVSL